MENSVENTEPHQSFRSPPRRRRSTFFERRESVVPQSSSEIEQGDVHTNNFEAMERFDEMSRYYQKLMTEKDQWKKEVNERRNKYHDLRQQYKMALNAPTKTSMLGYSTLTNEDIEFLNGKPHISALIDRQQKFHKSIRETVALVRRANELEEFALQTCEERTNRIYDYIFENSTIGPTE